MPTADHVTGLEPRAALEAFFAAHRPDGTSLAMVLCDVMGLKHVNERDGFIAGDACLRQAADRLRAAAYGADIVARLGGDELVAVFTGPAAPMAANRAAALLSAAGQPPLRVAASAWQTDDTPATLTERLYATVRRS